MIRIPFRNRDVGDGLPVFVIAEAGSNHNGSFEQALKLIDVAVTAGADAVKFQTFKAAHLYPRTAGQSDYLRSPKSIYRVIEEMEMPEEWIPRLAAYCCERGIEFLSTPFDERSADLLAPHVSVFKIASYELSHTPLLRHVARFGKPIVLSTGAHELSEIVEAVAHIRAEGSDRVVLLQCTAQYPAGLNAIHASVIRTLRESTGLLVGLSDHSRDPIIAPVVATALGAAVIEKHFTLSNQLPGPDHQFAVEPTELRQLVEAVRAAQRALGDPHKRIVSEEEELRRFARRSIFTTRAIKAGETLTTDNLAVLRCGKLEGGLSPGEFPVVLGKHASRELAPESPLRLGDVQ